VKRVGFDGCFWRYGDHRLAPMVVVSELCLFGNTQRVGNFDTKISDRTFQFGVSEQDLDWAQVSRLLVNQ